METGSAAFTTISICCNSGSSPCKWIYCSYCWVVTHHTDRRCLKWFPLAYTRHMYHTHVH